MFETGGKIHLTSRPSLRSSRPESRQCHVAITITSDAGQKALPLGLKTQIIRPTWDPGTTKRGSKHTPDGRCSICRPVRRRIPKR